MIQKNRLCAVKVGGSAVELAVGGGLDGKLVGISILICEEICHGYDLR